MNGFKCTASMEKVAIIFKSNARSAVVRLSQPTPRSISAWHGFGLGWGTRDQFKRAAAHRKALQDAATAFSTFFVNLALVRGARLYPQVQGLTESGGEIYNQTEDGLLDCT